jgi:hypothetical protein
MTRRRDLLSRSVSADGALALALSATDPQLALNTTTIDARSALSSEREQPSSNGSAITPAVSSGSMVDIAATVTGFGFAITNTSASDVIVVRDGTVTLTHGGRLNVFAAKRRVRGNPNGSREGADRIAPRYRRRCRWWSARCRPTSDSTSDRSVLPATSPCLNTLSRKNTCRHENTLNTRGYPYA